MDLGLAGKRALVLGASRGLGAAVARSLANEGAVVLAAARRKEAIDGWRAQLADPVAARVEACTLDLSDRAGLDGFVDRLLADGGVDILVNNGGGPPPGPALSARLEDWQSHFSVMAAHLFHLTGRLLPSMMERKWGRVITIGSSGIEQPIPNLALSNGIRTAVLGWSKTLAGEVAASGVTVNVVLPGRIDTERVGELDAAAAKRLDRPVEQIQADSRAAIPLGRYGDPQEFADVVTFLASERASYVTGSKIRVDGGFIKGI